MLTFVRVHTKPRLLPTILRLFQSSYSKDLYKILGISKTADSKAIKLAYIKLVKQYHPDINKQTGSAETFKDINLAHDILSNESKRKEYDGYLRQKDQTNEYVYKQGGFGGSTSARSGAGQRSG